MRSLHKLTATAVAKLKKPGRHSDGGNLYLSISPGHSKSWVFMWTRNGRKREMGLGSYSAVSLAKARVRAERCREQVADILDPIVERGKDSRMTFGEASDRLYESMRHEWSNSKTHYKWHRAMVVHCAPIRERPVAAVDTEDVLTVLNPIWTKRSETASKLRGRIERVLDYAKARGWREGENSARWRGHLQTILPKPVKLSRGHHASMDYRSLPAFFERLSNSSSLAARAMECTILTAVRTGELLNARWAEIEFEDRVWVIPAERMKGRVGHRVPLSTQAMEILEQLDNHRLSEFVFFGQKPGRPLSQTSMLMLLRRMKISGVTVHGFRSSFRDWAGDETEFPRDVAEQALAHKVGDAVERAYRRRDAIEKRRQLMQAWANYCCGSQTSVFVPMRVGLTR